jgi:hypothetical protein
MGRGLSLRVRLFVTLAATALGNSSAACTPFHDDPASGSSRGVADGGDSAARSVGVQGRQGFDLTAGGNVSKSPSYKLVGAVGESPGGNRMSKSTSYTVRGGVISETQ